ncbi:MAG: DUF1861 family protein [Acholeplasmatales bacterium]|nr:MAG: DUF1861 family protein [Acholeplasmatales bacterium]
MTFTKVGTTIPLEKLLNQYRRNRKVLGTRKLLFTGVNAMDVYNICQPFVYDGDILLPGRVERRDSEISEVRLFRKVCVDTYEATRYRWPDLQDPFVTQVGDRYVLGGTHIDHEDGDITAWRTRVFAGKRLDDMKHVFDAPHKMKDVRLVEQNGVHVFTRPQGGVAGRGKIGITYSESLDEITTEQLTSAPLLTHQFTEESWGGVNQAIVLDNGLIGVVGHIAIMSRGDVRHYYGMVFTYDPQTKQASRLRIICERADFGIQRAKRPDLEDVVFTGGLIRHDDRTATVYAGVGDAGAHTLRIPDPFLTDERL